MKELNPVDIINKIQKEKYKVLAYPIVVILVIFFLNMFYQISFLKYISIVAMAFYLFILWLYRIKTANIETNDLHLLSPINGKIIDLKEQNDFNEITVLKGFFQPAEIRTMSHYDYVGQNKQCESPSFYIEGSLARQLHVNIPHLQGELVGVAIGKCLAHINIPFSYELSIKINDTIVVGETIIGINKETNND
ncbi:MAG TPA: hypothetical protein PL063_01410 [Candidatus Cloacimonadota bacterium]|jgi:hypothetical protein|nr:hypothetical protein [Candidatus Cloacimonadales bacterium]HPY95850.1 hypothetical protein [Candidatus Cloacimonadota bacterium]HQB41055.1 hypothetical protein [Candidatus Cloacimonadota bacterium]